MPHHEETITKSTALLFKEMLILNYKEVEKKNKN